ncbi:MAG: STAS domain-containing protein [Thermoanaerobaculia bacterium]
MTEGFSAAWMSDNVVAIRGRFDAAQTAKAEEVLSQAKASTEVDFSDLKYISSAGIGTLLAAHKDLQERGCSLKLVNMNEHIRELFELAGFDMVFELE